MNVSDLTGADLDVWVARALEAGEPSGVDKYGAPIVNGKRSLAFLIEKYRDFPQAWSPSTKWEDGGPIIERGIQVSYRLTLTETDPGWMAQCYGSEFWWPAHSPLVAAMRAFVASKFGDTVAQD